MRDPSDFLEGEKVLFRFGSSLSWIEGTYIALGRKGHYLYDGGRTVHTIKDNSNIKPLNLLELLAAATYSKPGNICCDY